MRVGFILSLLCGVAFATAQNGINTTCHNYVIVSTRGTTELPGPSIAFKDMINDTLQHLPHGVEYDNPYPASFANDSVSQGVADLHSYLTSANKACPNQTYALLGYSQGAVVTALTLERYYSTKASPVRNAIKAVLTVGNPSHKPFQPGNIDQYGGNYTNNVLGSLYATGIRIPNVWYRSLRVLDVCHIDDIVCNGFPSNSSANTILAHLMYGSTPEVQTNGAAFLIANLTPQNDEETFQL